MFLLGLMEMPLPHFLRPSGLCSAVAPPPFSNLRHAPSCPHSAMRQSSTTRPLPLFPHQIPPTDNFPVNPTWAGGIGTITSARPRTLFSLYLVLFPPSVGGWRFSLQKEDSQTESKAETGRSRSALHICVGCDTSTICIFFLFFFDSEYSALFFS